MTVSKFSYPETKKGDVVDDYHGTLVPDPYRWLEEHDSPQTIAWGDAQNALTFDYLAELPARPFIHERLTALWNYAKYGLPTKREGWVFVDINDGLQNQPVLYKQKGFDGEREVLLDPNTLSDDGTVALMNQSFSKDGKLLAYSTSSGGSDWQLIRIRDVESTEDLDEVLDWCKFTGIAWLPDSSGFYYSRFPEQEDKYSGEAPFNNKLYFHKAGTPQSDDKLIYERPDKPELSFYPFITDDEQYLVLYVGHAAVQRNRVYYRRLDSDGDFIRLIDDPDAQYSPLTTRGSTLYLQTDSDAPKGRVVAVDLNAPERENWKTIAPESDDVIANTYVVNGQIVILYMHNAHHQVKIYELDGTFVRDIELPGIGTIFSMYGKEKDTEMFINFQSYLRPPTIYRYDFTTDTLSPLYETSVDFAPDDFETTQVFYLSKDGTQVSMFLTYKKGLELNGDNPTLLYGYGGYSIPLTPGFAPHLLQWVEAGGIYAVANLRGGSEYGEEWHKAGMLENKQNVFDDFISAAEWLISEGYTNSKRIGIHGRSNGGLLVAACMLQRPDLFGAVICGVPVTDMLRFHKFTAGRYWTAEYGNAEESAEQFEFMVKFSPVHNVKEGVVYPATLVVTADMDDRVVPMHAKKFTAALQAADVGDNPIMLRLDTRSGHGMGKPTSKWIDEWADIYAFLYEALGMQK
ncbi:MAG: prolyl oligopeptidase family serine peptidase [Aggregatilineales bacterium]